MNIDEKLENIFLRLEAIESALGTTQFVNDNKTKSKKKKKQTVEKKKKQIVEKKKKQIVEKKKKKKKIS